MPEELGKIPKPTVDQYGEGRKLIFVPLVFCPPGIPLDFVEKVNRYWDEVESHVANLESKMGAVTKVYHELIPVGDEAGSKAIQDLNDGSHVVVHRRLEKSAKLELIEDPELLAEFMDWSRCLSIGLQSAKVVARVYEAYMDVQKRRNEEIARRLNESLGTSEIGMLLMREGHQVQFPSDIRVFYVAPPSLNDIERWLRDREEELQKEAQERWEEQPNQHHES